MRGAIHGLNPGRGMVAIKTENGDFSVFENLNDSEFEVGDEVSWPNDTGLGDEPLTNHTQAYRTSVYFQNHHVHANQLRQQLLMT